MKDADNLSQKLSTWLADFEESSGSDKKRMVGWTVADTEQRDQPWNEYYSIFVDFRKELSKLDISSGDKV